jgi:uncharacterized protein YabN with tetrapyrrole methylase and pyrophosphatase domain
MDAISSSTSSPGQTIAAPNPGAVTKLRATGRLTIVGTGMKFQHCSLETLRTMQRAEKLFFAGNNFDGLGEWAKKLNPTAENLVVVQQGVNRRLYYESWVENILEEVRAGRNVVVAAYGHAGLAVFFSHVAIRRARMEGYSAKMLPGISSVDCLLADLGIDPGHYGIQIYMAHYFVHNPRTFDTRSHLVLLQPAYVGTASAEVNLTSGVDELIKGSPPSRRS